MVTEYSLEVERDVCVDEERRWIMKKEKIYIYYREGLMRSILSDIFSFGILCIFLFLNVKFLGNHWSVATIMVFLWIMILLGKSINSQRRFTNLKDLKEYVNNLD